MTRMSDLTSRFFGNGELADSLLETVADCLERDEDVQYRLRGTDGIDCERDDGHEKIPVAAGGHSVAVMTNRQLLFAVNTPNGVTTVEIPYTDIRNVETAKGLLGATLSVDVWADGRYTFTPADRDSLTAATEYLERVSTCWQRVVALLEDVRDQTETLAAALEDGRADDAAEASEALERKLENASERVATSGSGVREVLTERIRRAEQTFHGGRIDARVDRAEILMRQGRNQTDSRAYTGAYASYTRAREHLETALMIAIEHGFDAADIQTRIDDVANRIDSLRVRPIALAHQARERAHKTEHTDIAVQAWQDALDHYRDALTAGWGTDFDFSGDVEELPARIESTVEQLLAARRRFARELLMDSISYRDAGDLETAVARLTMAGTQLDAAAQLAREYRSGDLAAIREQKRGIVRHRSAITLASI